ncbi:serine/threonine-protein kinase MRCK alpha-like isoform X2 [Halichondria panicea]
MLKRHQTACFREERDVLVFGPQEWITTLHFAFQDRENLYLAMDYYLGGDVLTLISKYEDHLPEDMAKFYTCEMVLAIDAIHRLGYVHRDIKPDNVLIGKDGHIRLADFGSCLKMDSRGKVACTTAVGTPDYISPEILTAMEDGRGVYGRECDWWSLGICLYEMLFGETPFYAESLIETYGRIMQHKSRFSFPANVSYDMVSRDARDLIKKLICNAKDRLGRSGIEDFRSHPFFSTMDWDNMRNVSPPYIPEFSSPTDTRNFDPIEEEDDGMPRGHYPDPMSSSKMTALTVHLPFVGFTYTHNSSLSDNPPITEGGTGTSPPAGDGKEVSRLKSEMDTLKKQLAKKTISETSGPAGDDESSSKVRTLERTTKTLKSEKSSLSLELSSLREKLATKDKGLRGVSEQLEETKEENTRLTEKLSDVRAQKVKFSRLAREKGEEIEEMLEKVDSLRKNNRELDKERRALAADVDEYRSESDKYKKAARRHEGTIKSLEDEISQLKSTRRRTSDSTPSLEMKEQIAKLRTELSSKEAEHQEAVSSLQSKSSTEIQNLKKMLGSSEASNTDLQRENNELQLKLTRSRNKSVLELDQGLRERSERFDREKQMLLDQNKQLKVELDKVSSANRDMLSNKAEVDVELKELRQNRELLTQWERQIADIIQWVTEEKDARAYLKNVAKKLADDVDNLKSNASTLGRQKEEWMERRTLKRDKGGNLELQLQLKNEMAEKAKTQEQLTQITAQMAEMESHTQQAETEVDKLRIENEKLQQQMKQLRLAGGHRSDSTSHFFQSPAQRPPDHRPAPPPPAATRKTSSQSGGSVHELIVRTFDAPTKCDTCTSVMFGLVRQGLVCKNCQMSCHVHCKDKAVPTCPLPPGQAKLPFGIDIHHGVGTACEGWIKIPKLGGVKRGWQRGYAIVCDFKVFLHDPGSDIHSPAVAATLIFDIRDQNFRVSKVTSQDVIHAGPKLIPAIFKMSCNQPGCPSLRSEALILTDNEAERDRWVATLEELQKAAKQSSNQMNAMYSCREMYTTQQLEILKHITCAAIANPERVLLGDTEGLYMLNVVDEGLFKFSDRDIRKVSHIRILQEEGLIALLAGRTRLCVRLISLSALDSGDLRNAVIKVPETEGANVFTTGSLGPTVYVCAAVKNKVVILEVNRTKQRYEKKKEVTLPLQVECMQMFNEKLCVGYQSGFSLIHIYMDEKSQSLVHSDDLTLGFIRLNSLPAMYAVEINNGQEYILCFNMVGVYVNGQGRRSRKQELLWHSAPVSFVYSDPHLLVYCESALEIYDVVTAKWIQTISFRKINSLSPEGNLTLCSINEQPTMLYLKKQMEDDQLRLPSFTRGRSATNALRVSKKLPNPNAQKGAKKSSRFAISGPTNFTHVQHFGPYQSLNPDEMPEAGKDDPRSGRGQSLSVVGGHMPRDGSPSAYSLSAMDISTSASTSVAPRLSKAESLDPMTQSGSSSFTSSSAPEQEEDTYINRLSGFDANTLFDDLNLGDLGDLEREFSHH